MHTCAWRQPTRGNEWGGATMRIVVTFRTIFNLLIIAIVIGVVAGVYL